MKTANAVLYIWRVHLQLGVRAKFCFCLRTNYVRIFESRARTHLLSHVTSDVISFYHIICLRTSSWNVHSVGRGTSEYLTRFTESQ
jgi:hypothetical protein